MHTISLFNCYILMCLLSVHSRINSFISLFINLFTQLFIPSLVVIVFCFSLSVFLFRLCRCVEQKRRSHCLSCFSSCLVLAQNSTFRQSFHSQSTNKLTFHSRLLFHHRSRFQCARKERELGVFDCRSPFVAIFNTVREMKIISLSSFFVSGKPHALLETVIRCDCGYTDLFM